MNVFIDQLNRKVVLEKQPQRIISLVPSQTELLFDLGADEKVVGITKFCIHPESWFRNKQRVGGTKDFNVELIRSLQPDLILANKEENDAELLNPLINEFPVWVSDIGNLQDALSMIQSIGAMLDATANANTIISKIENEFKLLTNYLENKKVLRVAYLIWKEPWMSIGTDTFIYDLLVHCGFRSVFHQRRYPAFTIEELIALQPDLILLSSEPYPFKAQHQDEIQRLFPHTLVQLVDGTYFSWYGSRLCKSPRYFIQLREQLRNGL